MGTREAGGLGKGYPADNVERTQRRGLGSDVSVGVIDQVRERQAG